MPAVELSLPAPWAAGVVLGLFTAVLRPGATAYRGRVRVMQTPAADHLAFCHGRRCLSRAAERLGVDLAEYPWAAYFTPGHAGWAEVIGCRARAEVPFAAHMNSGQPDPPAWAWLLASPRPVWQGEPPPVPSQSVLFA